MGGFLAAGFICVGMAERAAIKVSVSSTLKSLQASLLELELDDVAVFRNLTSWNSAC
jgi:hypothetical protein